VGGGEKGRRGQEENTRGRGGEKLAEKEKGSLQLLQLDGTVELLHRILETLLVQQELPTAHPTSTNTARSRTGHAPH
jgi:hypothetical protein